MYGVVSHTHAYVNTSQPLRFGSYVNLVHATSLKFLTKTSKSANAEPQCQAMSLHPVPTIDAYFRVLPQFKSRSLGDLVYVGDTIYLQCCGGVTADFFLRATPKFTVNPNEDFVVDKFEQLAEQEESGSDSALIPKKTILSDREVNASNARSGWSFHIFAPLPPQPSPTAPAIPNIFPSTPIFLYHPESECYISHTIATSKIGSAIRLKEHPDNVKTIWKLERYQPSTCWQGGPLHWGEQLRLMHVPTKLYLDVKPPDDHVNKYAWPTLTQVGCSLTLEASRGEAGPMR